MACMCLCCVVWANNFRRTPWLHLMHSGMQVPRIILSASMNHNNYDMAEKQYCRLDGTSSGHVVAAVGMHEVLLSFACEKREFGSGQGWGGGGGDQLYLSNPGQPPSVGHLQLPPCQAHWTRSPKAPGTRNGHSMSICLSMH